MCTVNDPLATMPATRLSALDGPPTRVPLFYRRSKSSFVCGRSLADWRQIGDDVLRLCKCAQPSDGGKHRFPGAILEI